MVYRVANGAIPAVVETWLRSALGIDVVHIQPGIWSLEVASDIAGADSYPFEWADDRAPTLAEAIEAIVAQRGEDG